MSQKPVSSTMYVCIILGCVATDCGKLENKYEWIYKYLVGLRRDNAALSYRAVIKEQIRIN